PTSISYCPFSTHSRHRLAMASVASSSIRSFTVTPSTWLIFSMKRIDGLVCKLRSMELKYDLATPAFSASSEIDIFLSWRNCLILSPITAIHLLSLRLYHKIVEGSILRTSGLFQIVIEKRFALL